MTMFSMKPKFDLGEFLAESSKSDTGRKQARGMQYRMPAKPKDAKTKTPAETTKEI